jgi:hypothetical protein
MIRNPLICPHFGLEPRSVKKANSYQSGFSSEKCDG